MTADGTEVGTIIAVHDFGAGDILELRPPAGGTTIMLPFNEACVPGVDIAGRRIIVALPATTPESAETRPSRSGRIDHHVAREAFSPSSPTCFRGRSVSAWRAKR